MRLVKDVSIHKTLKVVSYKYSIYLLNILTLMNDDSYFAILQYSKANVFPLD